MTTALTTNGKHELAPRSEMEISREQVELIKRTIAKGTTDDEFQLFLHSAKRMGLDPLAKQIHAVKRWSVADNREIMSIQVSIDGYRLIADRTGNYAPGKANTYAHDESGKLQSATAYVMKFVRGTWIETSATAHMSEYAQTKKDGSFTAMWATKPHVMLGKCAEALALRRAFPAELSGVYTDDEMAQADNEVITVSKPAAPSAKTPLQAAQECWKGAWTAVQATNDQALINAVKAQFWGAKSDTAEQLQAKCDGMYQALADWDAMQSAAADNDEQA